MSTFPTFIIHWIGIAIMAVSVVGMALLLDLRPLEKIPAISSRIVVTKYILAPTHSGDQTSDLEFRIYMTNRGAGPGYGPELTIFTKLSNSILSDSDVDAEMAKDVAQAVTMPLSRKTHLEVNQEYWISIPNLYLRAIELDEVRHGGKYLYVWIVLTFLDDTLTDSKFWISEYCGLLDRDPTSIKIVRQRTYLHE